MDSTVASRGTDEHRGIEAAKKRLADARAQASSAANALEFAKAAEESAQNMLSLAKSNAASAKRSREAAESHHNELREGVNKAEKNLKEAEAKMISVKQEYSEETEDENEEQSAKRKKQKLGAASAVVKQEFNEETDNENEEQIAQRKEQKNRPAKEILVIKCRGFPTVEGTYKYEREGVYGKGDRRASFRIWADHGDHKWFLGIHTSVRWIGLYHREIVLDDNGRVPQVPPEDSWEPTKEVMRTRGPSLKIMY